MALAKVREGWLVWGWIGYYCECFPVENCYFTVLLQDFILEDISEHDLSKCYHWPRASKTSVTMGRRVPSGQGLRSALRAPQGPTAARLVWTLGYPPAS